MTFLGGAHLSHMCAGKMKVILVNDVTCLEMDVFGEINRENICSNLSFSWKRNIVMNVYVMLCDECIKRVTNF